MSRREPVSPYDAERGRELAEWRSRYPESWGFELEWDEELGIPVPTTRRGAVTFCGARLRGLQRGELCGQVAGAGTAHLGVGACRMHDTQVERAAGAWAVAHRIADIMEISPWEALLLAVKRAAAWAAFYDTKLGEVTDDEELRPGGGAHDWVKAAERVNDKLARYSKMAVDAGVAAMLVSQARSEGEQLARVLNAALGEVALDEATEQRLRTALRNALLAMEMSESVRQSPTTLEGEAEEIESSPPSEE
jgi:hypothetical protein